MAELSVTGVAKPSPRATLPAFIVLLWVRDAVMIGHKVAGVTIGDRSGSFSQHHAAPGFPIALEAIEDVFPPILQIRPLARILNDIEEELVAGNLEIFPVAIADGRASPHPRKLFWRYY